MPDLIGTDPLVHYPSDHYCEGLPQAVGPHVSVYFGGSACKTSSHAPPNMACIGLLPLETQHRHDCHNPTPGTYFPGQVGDPCKHDRRGSFAALRLSLTLMSDASDLGWEAHLGRCRTQGLWSPEELALHINIRELRVICLACKVFLPHMLGRVVHVLTDYTAVIYYTNKQGGV